MYIVYWDYLEFKCSVCIIQRTAAVDAVARPAMQWRRRTGIHSTGRVVRAIRSERNGDGSNKASGTANARASTRGSTTHCWLTFIHACVHICVFTCVRVSVRLRQNSIGLTWIRSRGVMGIILMTCVQKMRTLRQTCATSPLPPTDATPNNPAHKTFAMCVRAFVRACVQIPAHMTRTMHKHMRPSRVAETFGGTWGNGGRGAKLGLQRWAGGPQRMCGKCTMKIYRPRRLGVCVHALGNRLLVRVCMRICAREHACA